MSQPHPEGRDPRVELHLLAEVTWHGAPVHGGRTHALLAALAEAHGRTVGEHALVAEVWGEGTPPANPAKALQVVVSRTRTQTSPLVVERAGGGYRLGLDATGVDATALRHDVAAATAAEGRGDRVAARDHARRALTGSAPASGGEGPLATLRDEARRLRAEAASVLGRSLSALGDHREALPLLEEAGVGDEETAAALLRSLAVVHGGPAALDRYAQVRRDLADRLGVDPGPTLTAVHAELLAADNPVRSGLRHESTSLVGREDDIRALRGAVRESRVVSILGPGGLGKTRLAHLLGQEAEQPVVHFVELVGVASPDDVVSEVGSALGVRDSVSGRRVLTPEQRNDVRARTAQSLAGAPALLILDNCEHVVEAVADLVAFLVASCPRLHVVTTTRAPLQIAAERVFPLAQLDDAAASVLFGQRARAARPAVALDPQTVLSVVRRLDGLPLAIELAAARVRAMSVEDIDRRLDDRFALLRGGDRTAPDRHQTLLAVIDWSWNLLHDTERRALRWLSTFHDGFSLDGADAVLGHDALDDVRSLVDQSLLTVLDSGRTVRYRMLETVREFGRLKLVEAGEERVARSAQLEWACDVALRVGDDLWSPRQVEAVREVAVEENNLADALREALTLPDAWSVVRLLTALGAFWTIRGENPRVIAVAGACDAALAGWVPTDEQVDVAVSAAATVALNTVGGEIGGVPASLALLDDFGDRTASARVRGLVAVVKAQVLGDPEGTVARLESIAQESDREAAAVARLWAAHHLENSGDPNGAIAQADLALALVSDADGPWIAAMLHTMVGTLQSQLGNSEEAVRHARAALPVLDRLDAADDAAQTRSLLAVHAMSVGRLDEAEEWMAEIERTRRRSSDFGGASLATARAEMALARGQVAEGLVLYRAAVDELKAIRFPGMGDATGLEPWALFGESLGVTALAVHGTTPEDLADGRVLYLALLAKADLVLDPHRPFMDYPVAGLVLHGLGAWGLLRESMPADTAVLLLVLAERFGYTRFAPTMRPERTDGAAEARVPGLAARLRADLAGRTAPSLLPEARAAIGRVPGAAAAG
ncbi:MAG TPA: BTAD domain-containing putative transcriptional regulator [Ornithinibacter sp.]|nr:BTAD domain-containing putative transcriptional regulator [Ornithinibacter sp.]